MGEIFHELLIKGIVDTIEIDLGSCILLKTFQMLFKSMVIIQGMFSNPWSRRFNELIKIIKEFFLVRFRTISAMTVEFS